MSKKISNVIKSTLESNTSAWSKGKIVLEDGSTEEGRLQFNIFDEILRFQVDSTSKTYHPSNLSGFVFWDEVEKKERKFYSLLWEDPTTNRKAEAFFEVVREFNLFSVLSTTHTLEAYARDVYMYGIKVGTQARVSYVELIYFVDESGNLELCLETINREVNGQFISSSKNFDKDILEKYTGTYYEALRKYAQEKEMKFKKFSILQRMLEI